VPLPPLKPMAQSRRGGAQIMEVRLWIMIWLIFFLPPRSTCHQAPCSFLVWVMLLVYQTPLVSPLTAFGAW
jgi:hypothetical protein